MLLTLLFVPFVEKPESSEPPQQSPQQMAKRQVLSLKIRENLRKIRHENLWRGSGELSQLRRATGRPPPSASTTPTRVSYAQCKRCNRTVCGECQTAQDAGVVCPDCYRDLNGGASSPTRSFIARHWHITYTLILINVVVYGLQQIIPFRWVYNLGAMSGPSVHRGEYYRLITHGFCTRRMTRCTWCGT